MLAVEDGIGRHHAFLKRGGDEEGLERRPRLQRVLRKAVAVLARPVLAIGVGVEKGVLRPRQNVAGRHVHDHHPAPLGPVLLHGLGDLLLSDGLYLKIEGQMDILGGLRLIIAVHVEQAAGGVALHGLPHGKAAELLLKGAFHAFEPLAVHAHKAEKLARYLPIRINALVFPGQFHPRQIGLPHGLGRGVVHAPGHPHETAFFLQQGAYLVGGPPQNPAQSGGGSLNVRD